MKYIYSIFLFCIMATASKGQDEKQIDLVSLTATYNYTYQIDSTSVSKVETEEMILQIGKNYSKFTSFSTIFLDSILDTYKDLDTKSWSKIVVPQITGIRTNTHYCQYYIFKNYPQRGLTTMIPRISKQYYKIETSSEMNWKLASNEQKTILGYKCSKATTRFGKRNYEAWFTTSIPISDGPYKFSGLPGLILEIYDTQKHHHFEIESLAKVKNDTPLTIIETPLISATIEQYKKIWKANLDENYQKYQNYTVSEDKKAKILDWYRSMNNPIEK